LEEFFIRANFKKLEEVKKMQTQAGFFMFKKGNVLLIHLDESKTNPFADKRRNFNKIVYFDMYVNGNILCYLVGKDVGKKSGALEKKLKFQFFTPNS
jgi:hypothetical protein